MDIAAFGADDTGAVAAVVDMLNAVRKVDCPWVHPETAANLAGMMRHGWDGEAPMGYLGREAGRPVAAAFSWASHWDNRHMTWAEPMFVHPDERRRGYGTRLFGFLCDETRRIGRTTIGADGWESPRTEGFAAAMGLERKSTAINRRQYLEEIDRALVEQLYDEARAAASSYELVRVRGRTPAELLDAVAGITLAINDAPTDDLDVEDEVFTRERIEAYENATLAKGHRMYQVLALHKESGALAGQTVVVVEEDRPEIGDQHLTVVVREHRGHRLGLLLKTDMLRWLAEEEGQLKTIDTWNTESNDHMISVNERLGYRVLGRELQFQRKV